MLRRQIINDFGDQGVFNKELPKFTNGAPASDPHPTIVGKSRMRDQFLFLIHGF